MALLSGLVSAAGCAPASGTGSGTQDANARSAQSSTGPAAEVLQVPTTYGDRGLTVPTTTAGPVITLPPAAVASIPGGIEVTFGDALLHFEAGSAEIRVSDLPVLDAAAIRIRDGGYRHVQVVGHTSSEGTGNDALSLERADRVALELRRRLPDATITPSGAGSSSTTVDDVSDPARRSENRRVVVAAVQ